LQSSTPVQSVIIPGNDKVKETAEECLRSGFDVRAILYPTVPKGGERLRVVLHAFNTINELNGLIDVLSHA
jgi:8-amino-7-oxononanoate synthase